MSQQDTEASLTLKKPSAKDSGTYAVKVGDKEVSSTSFTVLGS